MGSDNKPGQEQPQTPYTGPDYGLWVGYLMAVLLVGLAAIYFVSLLRGIMNADYSRIPYSSEESH